MFALFCIPWAANAQTTVTIGDGTSTDYYTPIGTYYNYSITEQLYTADEIGMAGTISSISFSYAGTAAKDFPITVYMANVDAEDLSTGISLADAEVVFEGTYSVTGTGWMTITLDTPFAYDGTSNLLIGINKGYVYWYSGGNWNHTTTEAVMTRYSNTDNNAYDNSTVPGTTRTARPNIQMEITPGGGSVCEKPFFFATNDVTSTSCEVMWESSDADNIINLQYKAASESEWTEVNGLTGMTYTITDLLPGTVYNARVQVVCGEENLSGWKTLNFTTECGVITTFPWTETFESHASGDFEDPCWVNEHIEGDGTYLFKVYTSSNEGNTTHQLQLPDMAGGTLTKLVLPEMNVPANYEFSIDIYRSSSTYNDNYPNEGVRVYASTDGEIEGATELAFIPRHYEVSNDVIPAEGATGWYTYELPIGMSGTCYIILRGESQYCTATYMDNLAVKAMPTCIRPTSLAVTANSVTAHNATITWTENGDATNWIVEYDTVSTFATFMTETVQGQPTYTFTGLEPETSYYARVKADCGTEHGESEYSNEVNFITAIACPAPTGLAVNPGNYSAAVNWNGTSESYNVSYRTAAYSEGIVEEFNNYGVPSGWTRYTGLVDYVLTDSIQLAPATGGWATNSYALGQYNMKLNIYGASYVKHWLVTPEFKPSQDLTFDLALTDYNNSDPIENDTLQADDRFIVLVYADDAWHILREWNNSGSEYVYNAISAEGEHTTIGLSAYYGKKVKIAFYGESTSSSDENAGDNDLHIDNIVCGTPVEAGEWETVEATESPVVLTDLTPETPYEVKVQGVCDGVETEWTEVFPFTTEEAPVCKILVDADNPSWSEDFEAAGHGSTTPFTTYLPDCWTVVEEYTTDEENLTPPQVYYNPAFNSTDNGSYCFRMRTRAMVAMPELDESVDFDHLRMSLYVRQSFWSYKLEIGVVTDIDNPDENYTPVAVVNNSDKNVDYFECNFSSVKGLTGEGRYIVFKNVGGTEGDLYCNNYLDDITLTYIDVNDLECEIYPEYTEDFERYDVGVEPDCWEVITQDVALGSATRPQVYAGFNTTDDGSKSLRLKNRCVYAMPEFLDYPIGSFTMTFQLRQPKSIYRLQVGVVDAQGNFQALETFKCSNTTDFEEMTVNFADYEDLTGNRIAFRNTLVPGTGMSTEYLDYSINYIDDINFSYEAKGKAEVSVTDAMESDLDVVVYPNPTTDVVNVQCTMNNVRCSGIEIIDVYGKIITTVGTRFIASAESPVSAQSPTQINVSGLAAGMYFVRVATDRGVVTKPFVKR